MRKVPSSKLGRRQFFFFFCFKIIKEEYFIPVITLISVYLSLRSKFANELFGSFGSFLCLFSMIRTFNKIGQQFFQRNDCRLSWHQTFSSYFIDC